MAFGYSVAACRRSDCHFSQKLRRAHLPIYASPKKLRCEPESSIDRPGAPGRCPRAGISLPVSKRILDLRRSGLWARKEMRNR